MHPFDDRKTTAFPILSDYSWFNRLTLKNWEKDPKLLVSNPHQFSRK
jgi:hypothetical protein